MRILTKKWSLSLTYFKINLYSYFQNNTLWQKCLQSTSKILSTNDERFELKYRCAGEEDDDQDFEDEEQSEEELESQDHGEDSEITETSDNESDGDSDAPKKSSKSKSDLSADKPGRSSIVDDKFFKLSEMEAFLDSEDKKEMLKLNGKPDPEADSEDEIDYFNGNFSSEDENEEDEVEEDDDSAGVKYSGIIFYLIIIDWDASVVAVLGSCKRSTTTGYIEFRENPS